MAEQYDKKRFRSPSEEPENDSPEVKRLREGLFENFEDDYFCTTTEDLDSFMKSFHDEISPTQLPPENSPAPAPAPATDLSLDSGETGPEPDLGFLLEASDDELGLPPSTASPNQVQKEEGVELVKIPSKSYVATELWEFEEHVNSFESFGFGVGGTENVISEYVAIDGLFDYGDMGFGPADLLWHPETLPAQ